MIWSDNDVANDFTTMKNESGEQAYHPKFMVCGMEAYKVRLKNFLSVNQISLESSDLWLFGVSCSGL